MGPCALAALLWLICAPLAAGTDTSVSGSHESIPPSAIYSLSSTISVVASSTVEVEIQDSTAESNESVAMAAEAGDVEAQVRYGDVLLAHGLGERKAVVYYTRAVQQGSVAGMSRLARMLQAGRGCQQDEARAVQLYRQAAQHGDAQAQYALGNWASTAPRCAQNAPADVPCVSGEHEALHWLRQAANQEHTAAQTALALALLQQPNSESHAEAVPWLERAAAKGNISAMLNLAAQLSEGRGCVRDEARAVQWFRRAAEAGHAHAQLNLGNMLFAGRGVEKNVSEAAVWYRRAADQNHSVALSNLASVMASGIVPEELGTARTVVNLFQAAAEKGEPTAQYNLANMLLHGRGAPADAASAAFWYQRSAEQVRVRVLVLPVFWCWRVCCRCLCVLICHVLIRVQPMSSSALCRDTPEGNSGSQCCWRRGGESLATSGRPCTTTDKLHSRS